MTDRDESAKLSFSKSQKAKSPSEGPPLEMYVLRSQILASHNNICSDTHLQSHINAELGLSNRKDKVKFLLIRWRSMSMIWEKLIFIFNALNVIFRIHLLCSTSVSRITGTESTIPRHAKVVQSLKVSWDFQVLADVITAPPIDRPNYRPSKSWLNRD